MFLPTFEEDLMFNNINIYQIEITQQRVNEFMDMVLDEEMPNEYTLDLPEFSFKVNQSKKEFRILKRNYGCCKIEIGYLNDAQIDFCVYISYMTAIKSGFTAYLENKFNN
jgi:hypothetical protein